jgi:transcriptional regulator with XRE-family HTH domain
MAERENIPERLVAWRRRENLTQKEAAIRLGLPYGTYVGYEQDHRGKSMNEHRYLYIIEKTASAQDEATTGLKAGQKAGKTRRRKTAIAKAAKTRR